VRGRTRESFFFFPPSFLFPLRNSTHSQLRPAQQTAAIRPTPSPAQAFPLPFSLPPFSPSFFPFIRTDEMRAEESSPSQLRFRFGQTAGISFLLPSFSPSPPFFPLFRSPYPRHGPRQRAMRSCRGSPARLIVLQAFFFSLPFFLFFCRTTPAIGGSFRIVRRACCGKSSQVKSFFFFSFSPLFLFFFFRVHRSSTQAFVVRARTGFFFFFFFSPSRSSLAGKPNKPRLVAVLD